MKKVILPLSLILCSVVSAKESTHLPVIEFSKASNNWEEIEECESIGGNPQQQQYKLCSSFNEMITYFTSSHNDIYLKTTAYCSSPIAMFKGFDLDNTIGVISGYDNTVEGGYTHSRRYFFKHEFETQEACLEFVDNFHNLESTSVKLSLDFEEGTFQVR